jgi:hypothetical protein
MFCSCALTPHDVSVLQGQGAVLVLRGAAVNDGPKCIFWLADASCANDAAVSAHFFHLALLPAGCGTGIMQQRYGAGCAVCSCEFTRLSLMLLWTGRSRIAPCTKCVA